MISPVVMPQMGLEVTEARVIELLVTVGDQVEGGTPMLELETDKAITEVVAPRAGFVRLITVSAGDVVAVGAVLAQLADTADEIDQEGPPDPDPHANSTSDPTDGHPDAPRAAPTRTAAAANGRRRAAPVARRAALDLGVALEDVVGTGPRGRITLDDVKHAAQARIGVATSPSPTARVPPAPPAPVQLEPRSESITGLRRAIARRMTTSQLIPQYQLERDVDASHLLAEKGARAAAASAGERVNMTDLLIQAIAEVVVRNPVLATVFVEEPEVGIRSRFDIGVGLAVATDRGLLVPVIRRVDTLGLGDIAAERARLVASARSGALTLTEMSGGVITLSNLGGFGIDRFAAMVNPGESAIVAVGRVVERVVPRDRGFTVAPILTVTMTFDHRTVDGAVGAAALAELAVLLEGGMTWRP